MAFSLNSLRNGELAAQIGGLIIQHGRPSGGGTRKLVGEFRVRPHRFRISPPATPSSSARRAVEAVDAMIVPVGRGSRLCRSAL